MKAFAHKKMDSSILTPTTEAVSTESVFYNKKIVFTGDLSTWEREQAAEIVQKLGADVNTSISSRTNIVVIGKGAGPAKLIKIIDLLADGVQIQLMNERLFELAITPYKPLLGI